MTVYGDGIGGDHQAATFIVAASNSLHRGRADYVCTGVDDHVTIQAAVDALPSGGGTIVLMEGTFALGAQISRVIDNITIQGQGKSTVINYNGATAVFSAGSQSDWVFKDFVTDAGGIDISSATTKVINVNTMGGSETCAADIVVWISGSMYYVKNGRTGQIIGSYIKPDEGDVAIQAAVDACPYAGSIHFQKGDYYSYNSININKPMRLSGSSEGGCHIELASETDIPIFNCNPTISTAFITFEHFEILGHWSDTDKGTGIKGNSNTLDLTINNCFILRCKYCVDLAVPWGTHITNSCFEFAGTSAIYVRGGQGCGIVNNKFLDNVGHDIQMAGAQFSIADNFFYGTGNHNIFIQGVGHGSVVGNAMDNCGGSNIYLEGTVGTSVEGVQITSNWMKRGNYGVEANEYVDNCIVARNSIVSPDIEALDSNINSKGNVTHNKFIDLFMDVLAVSATHVRSNEDLSEAIPNTFTITAQPDVPRTLSGHFDAHANITAYTIDIVGIDAKGNIVTETKTEADGWDWETSNAFATITSIIMSARTGTGATDTMDIGITDVLGLSNTIYATGDMFKIKKNNANAAVAGAQVNATYSTYDMSVIGLGVGDDFTIWYKSNLNIIS